MIRGDEWLEHRGAVGKAMPFCELVILDDDQAPVPTGEIGFIYMRVAGAETVDDGRSVYMGVEGPRVTPDGFRTVGDMGRLDEEGYLYIADRRTDMIITGGANVFPAEVEAALRDHPGITDAAVVGVPDADWGRRVCAVVVPAEADSPPSVAALDAYMSGAVANYKRPKRYEFRDVLPLTEVGKLNRRVLTEECTARYAAEGGKD
ncbi:MAG: long-chain fatty acid--CoA ligase [Gammaproteobacteria bacterium]|nr:long-chain fatty acid--CoA ligase [Gammaproteobacteria bacterium]